MKPVKSNQTQVMPILPELLQSSVPQIIPQVDYHSGIFSKWMHNIRLKQLSQAACTEATIAHNTMDATKYKLQSILDIVSFSSKSQLVLEEIEHEREKIRLQKKAMEQTNEMNQKHLEGMDHLNLEHQLKNQLLQIEVQNSLLDLNVIKRELAEEAEPEEDELWNFNAQKWGLFTLLLFI
eukprot:TRINITY_DN44005_c0_g1_i1.p1 TRINITY_DN44005_c0_g1~~TRINITY_DN44005_c0_g1_i1.p1  ORF type:complete len:180 (+),score=17.91 TRINITY_DN44005_c0_g1_i1:625-1164(+)